MAGGSDDQLTAHQSFFFYGAMTGEVRATRSRSAFRDVVPSRPPITGRCASAGGVSWNSAPGHLSLRTDMAGRTGSRPLDALRRRHRLLSAARIGRHWAANYN